MTPKIGREHDGRHLDGRVKSSPVLDSLSWRPHKGSTWQDKARRPLGLCPAHCTSRAHRAGDVSGSTAPWSSTKRHPGTPPFQLLRQQAKYKMNATHSRGLVCLGQLTQLQKPPFHLQKKTPELPAQPRDLTRNPLGHQNRARLQVPNGCRPAQTSENFIS